MWDCLTGRGSKLAVRFEGRGTRPLARAFYQHGRLARYVYSLLRACGAAPVPGSRPSHERVPRGERARVSDPAVAHLRVLDGGPPVRAAPPAPDAWIGVAIFLGYYVLLVLVMGVWGRLLARRVSAGNLRRSLRRFNYTLLVARAMIPVWFAFGVFGLGWGEVVHRALGADTLRAAQLPGLLLATLPPMAAWMGLWWSQYPAEIAPARAEHARRARGRPARLRPATLPRILRLQRPPAAAVHRGPGVPHRAAARRVPVRAARPPARPARVCATSSP